MGKRRSRAAEPEEGRRAVRQRRASAHRQELPTGMINDRPGTPTAERLGLNPSVCGFESRPGQLRKDESGEHRARSCVWHSSVFSPVTSILLAGRNEAFCRTDVLVRPCGKPETYDGRGRPSYVSICPARSITSQPPTPVKSVALPTETPRSGCEAFGFRIPSGPRVTQLLRRTRRPRRHRSAESGPAPS